MLSFENINNKSIIDNNKSYKEPFSKQGKQIINIKENFINNVNTSLIENNKPTSGINDSIKENFVSNDNLFYFPSLYNLNTNINENEDTIEDADTRLNDATNLLNDLSMNAVKSTYSTKLDDYKSLTDEFNRKTQQYLNFNYNTKNVYVTPSDTDNKNTIFKGVYSDSLDSPSMGSIIQTSNFDDCKNTAFLTGKKYFGLFGYDQNNHTANCVTSNSLPTTSSITSKCSQNTVDNKHYGGEFANAIYEINSDTSVYKDCYNDKKNNPADPFKFFQRAMLPASWIVNWYSSIDKNDNYTITNFVTDIKNKSIKPLKENGLYKRVYSAGSYNTPPWNVNFPDNKAKWIWYTENANSHAPQNGIDNSTNHSNDPQLIFGAYLGPHNQDNIINGVIRCCCDNYCIIKVNGRQTDEHNISMNVNGWGIHTFNVKLNPYPNFNIIELYVINAGGPAGVILSIFDNAGSVICRTNPTPTTQNNNYTKSSDVGGLCIWLYSPSFSKVQLAGDNNYTVSTCAEYAKKLGYQYIGLQNIDNGEAQCYVSNNFTDAISQGLSEGYVKYGDKKYGIGNANAVYEFSNAATSDYNLIGSVGYVDESNNLFKYPNSMISYENTYTALNGYSSNMDINNTTKICNGLETCKQTCNSDINCNGFTFDSRPTVDKGYLSNKSNKKVFGYRNKTEELKKTTPNYKLYMRDPKINNHFSCSKIVNSNNNKITATDWANHSNIGNMNNETTCGLYKFNKDIQEQLETAKRELNNNRNELIDKTIDVITTNNDLHSQMIDDETLITNTSTLYDEIDDKYAYMVDNKNLNNILDNSNLVIKQSQYYYIIWIVLILLIIIGVIIILRRI